MNNTMECSDPVPPCSFVQVPWGIKKKNSPQKAEQPMNQTPDIPAISIKAEPVDGDEPAPGGYLNQTGCSMLFETPCDATETGYPISRIKTGTDMDLQATYNEESPSQDEATYLFNSNTNFPAEINKTDPLLDDTEPSQATSEVPENLDVTSRTQQKQDCTELRKCFVKLKRLPPQDTKQMTAFSAFPDGLSAIQTENGIWSARHIPRGTVFGPYDPPTLSTVKLADHWPSNMRIKQNKEKYNMVAEIHEKYLYYRAITNIQPKTELICKIKHKRGEVVGKPGRTGKYFKCQYCNKLIVHRSALDVHLRIHTGENPYKCHKCGICFNQDGALKRHVQDSHSSYRRKYKCKECSKEYLGRAALEYHMAVHFQEKIFKCPQCGKQFARKTGLRCHLLIHTGQKRHKCPQCPKEFYQGGNLASHMSIQSDVRPFPCKQCGKAFKLKMNLKKHIDITHLGKKICKCPICDKQFANPSNLRIHMLIHTGESPYECDICGRRFKDKAAVTHHRRLHTGERPYKCDQCDKSYVKTSALTNHKKTHTVLEYECVTCQSRFNTKRQLKLHATMHTGRKYHTCDICGKCFLRHISLDKHMATHSESTEKKYTCPKCSKSYFSEEYLKAHMKIHGREVDETPQCKECGKILATFNSLNQHMITHQKIKPHQCDHCGQYFSQKLHLRRHLAKHSGERPHKCEICGKDYINVDGLKAHMITHTDKKDHKCDICSKKFFTKSRLATHVRVHTGERLHECEPCGKRFPTAGALKSHSLVHSGEKPYQCEECGRGFSQKFNLIYHVNAKHRNIKQIRRR